jgi:predicted nucleotidyltransferase
MVKVVLELACHLAEDDFIQIVNSGRITEDELMDFLVENGWEIGRTEDDRNEWWGSVS